MTDAQFNAIRNFHSRCGEFNVYRLWPGNVIHGEQLMPRGRNVMMGDVGDRLRELHRAGVIKPIKFKGSVSGCAFLGLQEGATNEPRQQPHAGDAAHWTWEVVAGTEWASKYFERS